METGRMRHRVTLLSVSESVNSTGDTTVSTSTIATVYADVRQLTGKEYRLQTLQQKGVVDYEVTIRARTDYDRLDRLTWGARTLNVVAVLRDREGEFARLQCTEVV